MAVALAINILGKVADLALVPIRRHFGYLLRLNANVETLRDEAQRLDDLRVENQRKVKIALDNVEEIKPAVEKWLLNVDKIGGEAQTIIHNWADFPRACVNGCNFNLKSRYVLSRNAKKKSVDIVKLLNEGKFEEVSNPGPPVPFIGSSSTITFGSRELIIEEIIKNLKDDKINMVGICEMAGVGKTTTLEEVFKRLKEKEIFDEYAKTVVSQNQDLMKIQSNIANMLGLKLEGGNMDLRAGRLNKRLEGKKVLIMLDDVWEDFNLQALGITLEGAQKSYKVLFTSRSEGLWIDLRTKRDVPLHILSDAEAWDPFREKIGDFLEDRAELQPVAREIVEECAGLPLALVTLGRALLGKSKYVWDDTLRQLRIVYSTNVPEVSTKVHQSLKLSYDYQEEEEAKSMFLLCCLFEEDFDIPIQDLVGIGLGLRLFAGLNCLEQARNRVFSLVEQLQRRHLLLPSSKGHKFTKMHDVVRDVAKSIAFVEKRALVVDNAIELTAWQE